MHSQTSRSEPEHSPSCSDQQLSERQHPNLIHPANKCNTSQREVPNTTPGCTLTQTEGVPTNPARFAHEQPVHPPHGIAGASQQCSSPNPTRRMVSSKQTLTWHEQNVPQLRLMVLPKRPDSKQPSTILPTNNLHSQQVVVERTDIVRERACPSPSELLSGFVRRPIPPPPPENTSPL